MSFKFDRITYEDQFQILEKTGKWLSDIGVETGKTRFFEILKLNHEIVKSRKNNQLEELIEKHGNLKLWFALTEAFSFIQIYEAFKAQKSHIQPRSKLKKMLEGPYHSWDEDVNIGNIDPRNTLFELEAATTFMQVGAKINGFDDIDFVFKETEFNVQCKRLHSAKKVKDNITEAASQFYKKMKLKPNLKGIICLSLDKLTGKEEMILHINSANEIETESAALFYPFFTQYGSVWQGFVNRNILAVLLFVHVVAIIKETPCDSLTTCRNIAFDAIPHRNIYQIADYNLIYELGKKL